MFEGMDEEYIKEMEKKPRCERCRSRFFYHRLKTNERVCRICGFVKKLEEIENAD